MPRLPSLAIALLALVAALALAACGEKSEGGDARPDQFDLTLDFYANPDHAGIYMAQKLGYFEEAGLDVKIHTPSDPAAPIKQVAAGQTDLAISYEPEVLLAHDQGLDVVAVGSIVNSPLTSLMWTAGPNFADVTDFPGKTVATAGIPYQDAFLETILAKYDVDPDQVKSVNVGYALVPALLSGRADAILGGFRNIEAVELKERGRPVLVDPVSFVGVPTYDELVLVAQRDRLEDDPEAIRLFLAALVRGTAAAKKHREAATQAVLEANSALEPKLTRAQMEETLPLLSQGGRMGEATWADFIAWMQENELISDAPEPSEVLSNEYLPGGVPE